MFLSNEIIEISSDSSDFDSSSENSLDCQRKVFNCTKCTENFRYKAMLDRHMWTHQNNKPCNSGLVQCNYCDKAVPARVLDRHVRQVHNHESFYCNICKKFWITAITFAQHLKQKHFMEFVKNKKRYVCDQCSDVFDTHSGLIGHKKSHIERITYYCDYCMRKFHIKPHLRSHVQIHIKSKPFGCHLCKSKFRREDYLRKHLKRHDDLKFTCKYCYKKFYKKREFKKHINEHLTTTSLLLVDYCVD
ncbi:hypothetical protein PVAND_015899 [Polypedilum vanderplanki]|uniref:C2H2-type domain-containing protein n=1 Tax=Polypedilum vanderplanki TaxID=319348 RepID=A0A9J6BEI2_POLVA|nr:hypothetical protein PVAND_015899 [Polypedilum vanderplanki]